MNLQQIELSVYDQLNFDQSPDSAVQRRIRRYINDAQREILTKKGFGILRRKTLPAASIASSPYMVLPQAATSIIAIVDRTNNLILRPLSLQDVRYRDPGQNFTGSIPDGYAVIGYSEAVALQPSAADSIFAISDSVSDGVGTSVSIEGVITGGYYQRASTALNGLTAVNLSAALSSWTMITKFYISAAAAGNVTLRQTSGAGTELGRITPGRSFPRYTLLYLSGIPAAAQTYYCDVELHVEDMASDNDEPIIPEDFHWLLERGALKREYMKREKMDLWRVEHLTWTEGIGNLSTRVRRMAGVSVSGQRNNQGYQPPQFNSPWMNG